MIYQPFGFQGQNIVTTTSTTTSTTTTTTTTAAPMVQLPSGAIVVYDFTNPSSWAGSGSVVYDLSGNYFTGTFTGSIGSGSAGGVSFNSATSLIQCGNGDSKFYSAFDDRKAMYIGLQYQTGSMSKNTGFASTWDTNGYANFGYAFFINGGQAASQTRVGVQLYSTSGTGPQGYYQEPANPGWATGSSAHTLGVMYNVTSGSFKLYNDNVNINTLTGINTSLYFSYGTANADAGKGFRLGNRNSGENFLGQFKKFVAYNRALSDPELGTIEAWMTSSAPADYFPVNLNAGLIGRWEVTNPNSWTGTGTTLNNLSTGSQFSGLYASAMSSSAIDRTNGVQWYGDTTAKGYGMLFGVTGSFASGSYALNSAIIGNTNEVTALVLCYVSSSTPTNQEGTLINSWTDYNDQDFWLIGKDGSRAVRTNSGYNVGNDLTNYTVTNTNKLYGGRLTLSSNQMWRGTSNFATFGVSGASFGVTTEQAKRSSWTLGSQFNYGIEPNSMNRSNFQGKFYAAYIWNRILSDAEIGQLQTYTNKFIAPNS